jgi:hypothetical protein
MKRDINRPLFIVIDMTNIKNSYVCGSKQVIASIVGINVRYINPDKRQIYKQWFVLSTKLA